MTNENTRLTSFSKGSGCGCKIAPEVLEKILKDSRSVPSDTNLLVGNENNDDAAVYQLSDEQVLISTTDFFTPVVDDAFDFGRIAAANALSDVYAMGGRPAFALVVLGWPVEKLPVELCAKVMEGARQVCAEAGVVIAGGHSIDIPEPVFGLVVNGFANPAHIKRNTGVKEGDILLLTKPLGTGVYASAMKRGLLDPADAAEMMESITRLNKAGEQLGKIPGVHAMTDVTGFGLAGHLCEMMAGSGQQAELSMKDIPVFSRLQHYLSQYIFPDNTTRNYNAYKDSVAGVDGMEFLTLCDPQTNGGLLLAIDPAAEAEVMQLLKECPASRRIGKIGRPSGDALIRVV